MTAHFDFTVGPEDAGARLDIVVARHVSDVSRSLIRRLVDAERISINGAPTKASQRVSEGDRIQVELEYPPSLAAQPEAFPLKVVYHDEDLAVIDKPAGLVVHPAAGHSGGTLANALVAMFPASKTVGPKERPGIVHRLDKDTSGLMVVALTPAAQLSLQRQIASHSAQRDYLVLATGQVKPETGVIDAPIGRDRRDRKRMAIHGIGARSGQTSYQVREYLPGFTFLEARLFTGRTHQIRVHLQAISHPVAGDRVYHGGMLPDLNRQFLHAYRLSLRSPSRGEELDFTSPLPDDLQQVLDGLRSTGES